MSEIEKLLEIIAAFVEVVRIVDYRLELCERATLTLVVAV
jgi:hypothetical protein